MNIKLNAALEQAMQKVIDLAAAGHEAGWSVNVRKAGLVSARTMPMPSPSEETWRRSEAAWFFPETGDDIELTGEKLFVSSFPAPSEEEAALAEIGVTPDEEHCRSSHEAALEHTDAGILEANKFFNSEGAGKSYAKAAGPVKIDGVTVMPMDMALSLPDVSEHLDKVFFKAEHHQKNLSQALNAALRTGGAYTLIGPDSAAHSTVHIVHEAGGNAGPADTETPEGSVRYSFIHSIIEAASPCRASVVEHFHSSESEELRTHSFIEFDLSNGANLTYVLIDDWTDSSRVLGTIHARLGRDASLKIICVQLGGGVVKTSFSEDLNAPGANAEIYGTVYTDGLRRSDVDTFVHHKTAKASSNVLFNCALAGRSRSVFSGNILVDPGAQLTDAYQKNQNLMLSKKARGESMPKLEIIADDVRCTHGASFTDYDADQLFYLESRGLTANQAKFAIVSGFFREIIEKIEDPQAARWLSSLIQERFAASNALE